MNPTSLQLDKIIELSNRLNIANYRWLEKLIKFESNFNTLAKNPYSAASGLIQLTNTNARGYPWYAADAYSLALKHQDFNDHMDNIVYPYLKKYSPFPTAQSLYMAVFFPYARNLNPYTTFKSMYQNLYPTNWEEKYRIFTEGNPKIQTIADYINLVEGNKIVKYAIPGVVLAIAGFFIWKQYYD